MCVAPTAPRSAAAAIPLLRSAADAGGDGRPPELLATNPLLCCCNNRLVLAHVLGGAEAATDFRQQKNLKSASFLMETVTGVECEASPEEGTPVMIKITTEFTDGTHHKNHQRHQKWHTHTTHDIEELDNGKIMGLELYQYAADGVSVFENMCVGEKRKLTLTPQKGKRLSLFEYAGDNMHDSAPGVGVGTVNIVELVQLGHAEL